MEKNNKEAIKCMDICIKMNPNNTNAYRVKGLIKNNFSLNIS